MACYLVSTATYVGLLFFQPLTKWITVVAFGLLSALFVVTNSSVIHTIFPVPKRPTSSVDTGMANLAPGEGKFIDLSDLFPPAVKQTSGDLRVLTWYFLSCLTDEDRNIECGFKLPKIIEHLEQISPDIILLQEVDVHCRRSGQVNTGMEIAMALKFPYVYFACEGPTAGGVQGRV